MLKFIYWAIGVREEEQKNSINPNSFSPVPKNRFINYARDKGKDDDDSEPHKNIYEYKQWERSQKQKFQQKQYFNFERYFDKMNHS